MECRTCRMDRPAEMFRARANRPGQRETQCQECRAAHKRAMREAKAADEGRRFIPRGGRRWAPDPVKAPKRPPMPSPSALARVAWKEWMERRAPQWWRDAYQKRTAMRLRIANRMAYRARYHDDEEFRLGEVLRQQRRKALRGRDGEIIREWITGARRGSDLAALYGYSLSELKVHLERQFTKGMTWELFSRGAIHLDHRRPLRLFDLSTRDGWREAWSLHNLQPLWAKDNLMKGGRHEVLL